LLRQHGQRIQHLLYLQFPQQHSKAQYEPWLLLPEHERLCRLQLGQPEQHDC